MGGGGMNVTLTQEELSRIVKALLVHNQQLRRERQLCKRDGATDFVQVIDQERFQILKLKQRLQKETRDAKHNFA